VIFLTVGTQFPFDRLVRAVDEWAGESGRDDVVAQIGPSEYVPRFIRYHSFVSPLKFGEYVSEAQLIISHAGMGTILNALGRGKPILVMPRQARFNEHRNDHQMATARRCEKFGRILVAMDEQELADQLNSLRDFNASDRIAPFASNELLANVKQFIER
jgi:UDP-N-acetylglucosamine transferase subunit ALG13